MESFTKEHVNKDGVNYLGVAKLFQSNDVQPYAVTINGYVLIRACTKEAAVIMGECGFYLLYSLGYKVQFRSF